MVGSASWPVNIRVVNAAPWEDLWVIERITTYLSASFAVRARCSQICRPGTLVGIGLNMLRNFNWASGSGSNESMCLNPAWITKWITEMSLDG
jgi:hypothetical protein